MSDTYLKQLLEKATADRLSPAEQAELESLLENPASQPGIENELAPIRNRIAKMIAYRQAVLGPPGTVTSQQYARFERTLAELRAANRPSRRSPRPKLKVWSILTALTLAACLTLILWRGERQTLASGAIELAVVNRGGATRGQLEPVASGLGQEWQVVELTDLRALDEWSRRPLPADVRARIWIDEESESLRGLGHRRDGTQFSVTQRLDRVDSADDQLRAFARRLIDGDGQGGGTPPAIKP